MTTAASAPVPAKPTEESAYDAMASAFDSLLTPDDVIPSEDDTKPVVPASDSPPPAAAEDKEGEEAAATTPATAPVDAPADEEPPADTPPSDAAKGEAPSEENWEARFKELEARVAKQAEEAAAPPAEKPPVEAPPPDVYTAEEKDFLKEYAEQWPDIVKGEELRRRDEYRQLVTHIFSEIARVWAPLIERGAQAADTVAETTTLGAIQRVHGDYDDAMYEDVLKWADTLTGTRKRVVQEVISEGEPHELIDLLTEFKQATGRKPKVVAGTAAPAAQPADVTELSAKAKQAAKALGVVDSKRTAPASTAVDPNDFDAAWNEAVSNK